MSAADSTADAPLSAASAPAYVARLLSSSPPFDLSALVATEISDGNLNFAFKVAQAADAKRAVFLKQAPAYIKCLGPAYALAAERLNLEADVLAAYADAAPAHVPALLARDAGRCAMVLEYLDEYELLRSALHARCYAAAAAEHVARFMALTHARTWARPAAPDAPPHPWAHVANESMCGITAAYVFEKPLDASDETNRSDAGLAADAARLRADNALRDGVDGLRAIFLTSRQCLVHGDLHTGSVMVPRGGADGPAKVIDCEFAHFGCAAFDVGTFLAHLIFAAIAHGCSSASPPAAEAEVPAWPPVRHAQTPLHTMLRTVWETYVAELRAADASPLGSDEDVAELLDQSAGFAGCELIRRVLGAAHVDDLELLPTEERLHAEKVALAVGRQVRPTLPHLRLTWPDLIFPWPDLCLA